MYQYHSVKFPTLARESLNFLPFLIIQKAWLVCQYNTCGLYLSLHWLMHNWADFYLLIHCKSLLLSVLKFLKFGKIVSFGENILSNKRHRKEQISIEPVNFLWKNSVPYNQEIAVICFLLKGKKHQSSMCLLVVQI